MITQFYHAGDVMVKVVIDGNAVTIYDTNLARHGVTAERILEKDEKKMEEWKKFMKKNPSERMIADELEGDFKTNFGLVLSREVDKNE